MSAPNTENFFRNLPARTHFSSVSKLALYQDVPEDWLIVLTDIRGSTQAIENGRYKQVNMVGAATIIALLNAAGDTEIPYVFGGDGAALLVPPSLERKTRSALRAARQMARDAFGFELRIGMVPVADVREAGVPLQLMKYRMSEHITQAMFSGGGLAYAEKLLKAEGPNPYLIDETSSPEDGPPVGDFSGLECRWQPLKAQNGEIVSLLVKVTGDDGTQAELVYNSVLKKITEIYGFENRPVKAKNLRLSASPRKLANEARVRTHGLAGAKWLSYTAVITFFNWLWKPVFGFGLKLFGVDWGKYRNDLALNSDDRKFDDMLRMILDGSTRQREELVAYLDRRVEQGTLVYGIHVDREALVTCLVFDRKGRHVHFVDGNNGGYALAAKALKKRIADSA